jgi:hypothetical protein
MSYWRFQALSELNDLIMGKAPADQIERIDIDMPEAAYGHGGSQAVRPLEPIGAQMNVACCRGGANFPAWPTTSPLITRVPQIRSSADFGHGYARLTLSRVIWLMFSAPTCRMIVVNSSSRISSTRSTPGSPNEARPHT